MVVEEGKYLRDLFDGDEDVVVSILYYCILCELNFAHIFDDFVSGRGPIRVARA